MKIFCSYAFTDENSEIVIKRMTAVVGELRNQGHDVYCDRFDCDLEEAQDNNDVKAIFNKAFHHLTEADLVIAIVSSPNRSVGQIMEIGVATYEEIPIYLFEHKSAVGSTYLKDLAKKSYAWNDETDLLKQLKNIK